MGLTIGPATWHPAYADFPLDKALGAQTGSGFLICKAGGIGWIVSPYSTEVSRCWYCRDDAVTTASALGCTGWFVPTCSQLINPGYICRSFWGPSPCFSSYNYWAYDCSGAIDGYYINFGAGPSPFGNKNALSCVRAFRCVTY